MLIVGLGLFLQIGRHQTGRVASFPKQALIFIYVSAVQVFLKTLEKGEITRKRTICLFQTVFYIGLKNFLQFSSNVKLSFAKSFCLKESEICHLGKG